MKKIEITVIVPDDISKEFLLKQIATKFPELKLFYGVSSEVVPEGLVLNPRSE